MAATRLPDAIGLPTLGNRKAGLITWTGPASYTQVTPGSPPTGGQSIPATAFGLKFLDGILVLSADATGTNSVVPIIVNPSKATTAILLWNVIATGAQASGAANLSAITVALYGIGR